ncbi:MAG: large-conductance mechanosensitive channel protein MscL [Verrucomicrobia bacterium]|nr:large-conductance mechanosensitive channel protein MscL [Verrucomicrobiota bacterium]
MGLISEFKTFAMRGNVVDLAVGVIIGGAFGKITTSLVNDVIMPPIGRAMSGMNFADLKLTLNAAVTDAAGVVTAPAVTLNYGAFINTIIDFAIVAFALFMLIKAMNTLKKKEAAAPAAPATPPADVLLLTEIRDLLKQK